MPLISIITPTYNRATLLPRMINSVKCQNFTDWELIIVDDGSTDSTKTVIQKYLNDPRVRYLQKENTGAAHSRNVGVNHATGKLITFLDSDDEATEDWLAKVVGPFNDSSIGVVCCGATQYNAEGGLIRHRFPTDLGPSLENYRGKFTNGGVFTLRKQLFQAIEGYNIDLKASQHTELALRLTPYLKSRGLKIFCIEESLIKVHIHTGARIRFNHLSVFEGSKMTFDLHCERLKLNKKLYNGYLRVIIFNGFKAKRITEAKKYLVLLLKEFPLDYKGWFYFSKFVFRRW